MKAIATASAADDANDPVYEEIPCNFSMEATGDAKCEVDQLQLPRRENPYTVHPSEAELENSYDCPIVPDEDGSIKDGDIYIEGAVPETSFTGTSVYYNTSPTKKDDTALETPTDVPYDVPKSNEKAPQALVATELGVQLLQTVDSEYEVMHTPGTLESEES